MNFTHCVTRCYQNLSYIAQRIRKSTYIIAHSDFYEHAMSEFILENKMDQNAVGVDKSSKVMNSFSSKDTTYKTTNLKTSLKTAFTEKNIFCSFEVSPTKNNDFYER